MVSYATERRAGDAAASLEEHRVLHASLDALGRLIACMPDAMYLSSWSQEVAGKVRRLRVRLAEHFAREQSGGFFDDIQTALPASGSTCSRLLREHEAFLGRLDSIAAQALLSIAPQLWAPPLRDVIKDLMRHEAEESALLFEALEAEPGAPD
jgi:hypothetical protein